MSGDGLKDSWLWDERGDLAHRLGQLQGYEVEEYQRIQKLRKEAVCSVCGDLAQYHNVSGNGDWKCWKHEPDDVWEYDFYELM